MTDVRAGTHGGSRPVRRPSAGRARDARLEGRRHRSPSGAATASAEAAVLADQAALAPVPVDEEIRSGQQHPAVVRPDPHQLVAVALGLLDELAEAALGVGAEVRPDAVGRVDVEAVQREPPGRAGRSIASSKSVSTSRSPETSRSQSGGIEANGTESGWYAQARNSAGVGSTGLAKPWNVDSCTLTGQPSALAAFGNAACGPWLLGRNGNPPSKC